MISYFTLSKRNTEGHTNSDGRCETGKLIIKPRTPIHITDEKVKLKKIVDDSGKMTLLENKIN